MTTRTEAQNYVITTLGDYVDDHDVDAIIDEVHDYLGHYDFDQLDTDDHHDYDYWEVVKKHTTPEPVEIQAVIDADNAVQESEEETTRRVAARAVAVRAAIDAGHTQTAIALALNVSQPRVAQMMKQGQ